MRVATIIVNYRTPELAADCLRSLSEQIEPANARVMIVDNGSGDHSLEYLQGVLTRNRWSTWTSLLPLPDNRGYAAGNNAALRSLLAQPDPPQYVWLLNPDCIARPGALSALLEFMDIRHDVAIAGSGLEDHDGNLQCGAFRFPSRLGEFEQGIRWGVVSRLAARRVVAPPPPVRACRTDWVMGASMIIRREVFERIGLLDEDYFLYFEDVDFCLQAQRAGFACWFVPESRVVHLAGRASGVTDSTRANQRRPAYWFHSRQRYFRKNFGLPYTLAADLVFFAGFLSWRLRRPLQRKPDDDPAYFVRDFLRHSAIAVRSRAAGRSPRP